MIMMNIRRDLMHDTVGGSAGKWLPCEGRHRHQKPSEGWGAKQVDFG